MDMTRVNPYPPTSFEYQLWETWNRAFFQQPVHAQVLEVELQLRQHIHVLNGLAHEADVPEFRTRLIDAVLALEVQAEELNEIAEHQFMTIVNPPAVEEKELDTSYSP